MVIPSIDSQTGLLPLGRYATTLGTLRERYVDAPGFAASTTRLEIWQHFLSATQGIRSLVPVVCVWIGGSFLTEKLNPDDIDLLYWCEDNQVAQLTDSSDKLLLQLFASNKLRSETGLRVDTRVCNWHLVPEPHLTNTIEHRDYVSMRGFWDDFWMRKRTGGKHEPAHLADSLPKSGYLEVTLDGFNVL